MKNTTHRLAILSLAVTLVLATATVAQRPPHAAAQLPASITVLPGAGTGATATLSPGSTDQAGTFTLTTGPDAQGSDPLVQVTIGGTHRVLALVGSADATTADQVHQAEGLWATPGTGAFTMGMVSVGGSETYTVTYLAHLQ